MNDTIVTFMTIIFLWVIRDEVPKRCFLVRRKGCESIAESVDGLTITRVNAHGFLNVIECELCRVSRNFKSDQSLFQIISIRGKELSGKVLVGCRMLGQEPLPPDVFEHDLKLGIRPQSDHGGAVIEPC